MTIEEAQQLYPGDEIELEWGKKIFNAKVVAVTLEADKLMIAFDSDKYKGDASPAQATFIQHDPKIEALIKVAASIPDSEILTLLSAAVSDIQVIDCRLKSLIFLVSKSLGMVQK